MSESKMVTEREIVLREREAFLDGCAYGAVRPHSMRETITKAAERFPLPKVERPRVAADSSGVAWRVNADGAIEWRWFGTERLWTVNGDSGEFSLTDERVKLLADLLANPTELVEDTP